MRDNPIKHRSASAKALRDPMYRQRRVRPKRGKGSYRRDRASTRKGTQ